MSAMVARRRLRFFKAYGVTLRVLLSYARMAVLSRLWGHAYYESRISALHNRNARRIERSILELQGLFIKVGQLISIMTNFLPEEFRKPLESLQDQVPPRPLAEIRARIEAELGAPPEELFADFDATPLASASLGQVHRATLKDGSAVVVKVQHLHIEEVVRLDLGTIWRIFMLIGWFVPVRGLSAVYTQLRSLILSELDFRREADCIERIGANLSEVQGVQVPALYRELCSERVLTMGYLDGTKISDLQRLNEWNVDRSELGKRLLRAYCRMIFIDGVYHADPHPGNLLVLRDGTLALLDFGAVAELSPVMREGIPRFLEAVIKRDTQGIVDAMRKMGFIAHGTDAELISERIIEYFHLRFQERVKLDGFNLKDIRIDPQKGLEDLLDLRRHDIGFRELMSAFQVPKDWVLLERTLLLMSGVCTHLDPQMNPMTVIQPYLQEFVVGKDRDLTGMLVKALKESAIGMLSVPQDIRRYIGRSLRGELQIRVQGLHEQSQLVYNLGQQLITALFVFAGAGAALWSHQTRAPRGLFVTAVVIASLALLRLLGLLWSARKWQR